MAVPNHYQQYKKQSILTMTSEELLLVLFDELVKRIKQAEASMENKNIAATNDNLMRAQNIVRYLIQTLNEDYAIAEELKSLYNFFLRQLIEANTKKDVRILKELEPLITDMCDTWKQAARLSKER